MNSRTKLNIALLVVVAGLGALAWFKPGARQEKPASYLADFKPDKVSMLKIDVANQPEVTISREDGRWQLQGPISGPADPFRVKSIITSLHSKSLSQYQAGKLDLTKYGLAKPEVSVSVDGDRFEFGDTESLSHHRYVKHGDTVHLVSDTAYYQLKANPSSLLDKRLLPEGSSPVLIKLPDQTLSRDDKGHWQLAPANKNVSADDIQKLVDHWTDARAISVDRTDPKAGSSAKVTIMLKGRKQPLLFKVIPDQHSLVLARPDLGLSYHLAKSEAGDLLQLTASASSAAGKATPSDGRKAGATSSAGTSGG
ncbi:MAG: DUF4340 domain-containing protein [Gammaproteobacteria bacterium]|jgi:VCBS repeat-containing protein